MTKRLIIEWRTMGKFNGVKDDRWLKRMIIDAVNDDQWLR